MTNILILESSQKIRDIFNTLLTSYGYLTIPAATHEEASKRLGQADLLFIDGENKGYAAEARETGYNKQIVLFGMKSQILSPEEAKELTIAESWQKPCNFGNVNLDTILSGLAMKHTARHPRIVYLHDRLDKDIMENLSPQYIVMPTDSVHDAYNMIPSAHGIVIHKKDIGNLRQDLEKQYNEQTLVFPAMPEHYNSADSKERNKILAYLKLILLRHLPKHLKPRNPEDLS